jgi:hypothetical protein
MWVIEVVVYGWAGSGWCVPMLVQASTQRLSTLSHLFSASDGAKQSDKVRDAMQQSMTYLKLVDLFFEPPPQLSALLFFSSLLRRYCIDTSNITPDSPSFSATDLWEIAKMTNTAQMHGWSRR